MKIAICDDESVLAESLKQKISAYLCAQTQEFSIDVFTNPLVFLENSPQKYDIVFLDVVMGNENGMTIAQKFRDVNTRALLVFVSAFVEYAPKGFELNTFRYLLKDNLDIDLNPCLKSALVAINVLQKTIKARTMNGENIALLINDILYAEITGHNIAVHSCDGVYNIYGTLSSLEDEITSKDFARIKRSLMVNLRKIVKFKGCEITLANGEIIQCSRSAKAKVLHRFFEIQGDQ